VPERLTQEPPSVHRRVSERGPSDCTMMTSQSASLSGVDALSETLRSVGTMGRINEVVPLLKWAPRHEGVLGERRYRLAVDGAWHFGRFTPSESRPQ
jgi:hypothetical protein